MGDNKFYNDLEALDISVLLDSLYESERFDFVLNLLKEASYWLWKAQDLYHDNYCFCSGDPDYDEMILNETAEATESYHRYFDEMDSFILVLLDVFGSMVRNLHEDCHSKGLIVDMKILLDLLPKYRIKIINMCLEYVDKGMEAANKQIWVIEKDRKEQIAKLEELKAILIAIRDEDVKIMEKEKTD